MKPWATPLIALSCAVLAACNSAEDSPQHATDGGSGSASHLGGTGSAGAGSAGAGSAGAGSAGAGSAGADSAGGTGGQSIGAAGGGGSSIGSCEELAAQACARLAECAPYYVEAYYADQETCRSLFAAICNDLASGSGVNFERCSQSLSSCTAIVDQSGVPSWCWQPRGAVPLGGQCSNDTECDEGLCQREKGATAGACAAPGKAGASCEPPLRCAIGLHCSPLDYSCFAPAADGQNCQFSFDCSPGSSCKGERCGPSQLGDACDSALLPCAPAQSCLLDQCAELPNADETHSCAAGFQCSGTKRCAVQQTGPLDRTGECRDAATEGATCDALTPCLEPLTCRSGKCRP
jgi:hypothetical protein